jgi:hypothetical protein
MMSLGAAIAGLAGGYAKGVQIKSDLEDAKQQRGLRDLQKQQAELELDRNKQLEDLRRQTSEAVSNFRAASLDDVDSFNNYYGTLEGLIVKEASLSGKDPVAAFQSMEALRRDKFAERVFAANQMLQMGNDAGFEILKPVFNQHFKDGQMLMGGTFNKALDSYSIRYQDREGNDKMLELPRQQLMDNLLLKMLNPQDAAKLMMRDRELEKSQKFESSQLDKKLASSAEQGALDRSSRFGIAQMQTAAELEAAGVRAATGRQDREVGRDDAALKNFDSNLAKALGFDEKLPTESGRKRFEQDAVPATNIFRATNDVARVRLTANEAVGVLNAVRDGSAEVRQIPGRPGFLAVQAGTTRAVIPAGMIRAEQ